MSRPDTFCLLPFVFCFPEERDSDEGVIPRKQWIYKGEDCVHCPVSAQCSKAKYRTIAREKREPLQEEMRRRLLSEEGRERNTRSGSIGWSRCLGILSITWGLRVFF
jgi:hypothetical protein